MFFIFRFLTAVAGISCLSIGGSIIGDIRRPKERGRAMGLALLGTQLSPCCSPALGGLIITFTNRRAIFWVMTCLGGLDILLVIFCFERDKQSCVSPQIKGKKS